MELSSLNLQYEEPGLRNLGHTTHTVPVTISIYSKNNGVINISKDWLKDKGLLDQAIQNGIAIQVKGKLETYIVFNPPIGAPKFFPQSCTVKNGKGRKFARLKFSGSHTVRKIMHVFVHNLEVPTSETFTLEKVGHFKESVVYRLEKYNKRTDVADLDYE